MDSRLPAAFYQRADVVGIARELIGKKLVSQIGGRRTAGIIVETEAYAGEQDKASHAYNARRTKRTSVMYGPGGLAYVYLCYGIHHLFNIVVNLEDIPHAILVRALEPAEGMEDMMQRCGKTKVTPALTAGPGCLTRALGITVAHSGADLVSGTDIWIEENGLAVSRRQIIAGTRVGVAYAGEDALRPYRFSLKGNPYVSKGRGL